MENTFKFIAEPYRLFFPLGWLMGIIGTTYWLVVSTGFIASYKPLFHGLIQIELFACAFAVGFLLTALPKFLRTKPASKGELWCLVIVYIALVVATLGSDALKLSQWLFIFLILLLVRFALIRIRERKALPPFSFLLVGFGLLEGVLGALLIIYPSSIFPFVGEKLLEQGMFLSLSLGVGSFLGPRLMGVVDTENAIVSLPGRAKSESLRLSSPAAVVCAIGLLIFISFFIESGWNREIGLYLRAGTAFFCLKRFSVIKIPRSRSVAGILTAIALWLMPLGILLAALLPNHETGMLHITYIGGFALLILTIGAQVITSHGGIAQFWQSYKPSATFVAILIGVSLLIRTSASLFPPHYLALIGSAAFVFDMALLLWGIGVLRYIRSSTDR